jgi:hypothetical protein
LEHWSFITTKIDVLGVPPGSARPLRSGAPSTPLDALPVFFTVTV